MHIRSRVTTTRIFVQNKGAEHCHITGAIGMLHIKHSCTKRKQPSEQHGLSPTSDLTPSPQQFMTLPQIASSTAIDIQLQKRSKLLKAIECGIPVVKAAGAEDGSGRPPPTARRVADIADSHTCDKPKISYHQLAYYVRRYLGDLTPEFNAALVKPTFASKMNHAGTLSNGTVRVGVSTRSNSTADDVTNDDRSSEKENNDADKSKRLMLGLFSAHTIEVGEWVTAYGGVRSWAWKGQDSVKVRPACFNTHVRRLPRSDSVLDGRPYALLFPRIFSRLQQESIGATRNGKNMYVNPLVSVHSLINVLLRLHHEATQHGYGNMNSVQLQQEQRDACNACRQFRRHDCQGSCHRCLCTKNLIIHHECTEIGKEDKQSPINASPGMENDVKEYLSPSCILCNTYTGMLPCEVDTLLCSWTAADRKALDALCTRVQEYIRTTGVGYMANTDMNKACWNARVIHVNPYKSE
jgi:hypothetical protein